MASLAFRFTKFSFGQGSAPDPDREAPDPLVGWKGTHPFPFPTPLDVFGVSLSTL